MSLACHLPETLSQLQNTIDSQIKHTRHAQTSQTLAHTCLLAYSAGNRRVHAGWPVAQATNTGTRPTT